MKTIYSIALTGSLLLIFSGEIHAQGGSDLKTILELARTTDNVNYTDAFDRTLLMHASAKGYKNACRILIRRGADPNMQAIDGVIAAMYASYNGHTGIVKLLLEKGLNSDSQETDGTNALLINARDELAETIKSLFYNPLKADSLYTEQMTAIVTTAQNGCLEAVRLSKRKEADFALPENYNKTTAFIRASRSGQISIVKALLKREARLDMERTVRLTDLMASAVNGHTEIVKLLLEKGANPDLKDNESKTALDYAGNPDIRKLLTK